MSNEANRIAYVNLEGRDELEVTSRGEVFFFHFAGCEDLAQLIFQYKKKWGNDLRQWPTPIGITHSELMLKELLLKLNKQWNLPYKSDEICHCRIVPTIGVQQAVLAGAHTPEKVSRWTSASTACGTCRPDVQKVIDYYLEKSSK